MCILSATPVAREPENSPARYLNLRNLHALLEERLLETAIQEVILLVLYVLRHLIEIYRIETKFPLAFAFLCWPAVLNACLWQSLLSKF